MSGRFPPLTAKHVEKILENLGFSARSRKGTSHEQWVGMIGGKFRKVTLDRPKSPFGHDLIRFMAAQAGVSKKRFYAALAKAEVKD